MGFFYGCLHCSYNTVYNAQVGGQKLALLIIGVTLMSNAEILDLFNRNPNLMLSELAVMTGKTVKQLKAIIMSQPADKLWGS